VKLTGRWRDLPVEVRKHLVQRLADRSISEADLNKFRFWIEGLPEVPEGDWYKDFGTFKLAGRSSLPLTFLSSEQIGFGVEIKD
jgi:hypothetical protein